MKNFFLLVTIFSCLVASAQDSTEQKGECEPFSEHETGDQEQSDDSEHEYDHHGRVGAYLEFDTEGSHGDQVRRSITHGAWKVTTAPFRAVGKGAKMAKHGVEYAHQQVDMFSSPAASVSGRSRDLRDNFEFSQDPADYIVERDRNSGHNVCFGLPGGVWKLTKSTGTTIFIRLPRATWRTLKSFARGTCDCAGV